MFCTDNVGYIMKSQTIHILPKYAQYVPVSQYLLKEFYPEDMDEEGRFNIYRDYSSKAQVLPYNALATSKHKTALERVPEGSITIASHPICEDINGHTECKNSLNAKAKNSIQRQIDLEVFRVVRAAVTGNHKISICGTPNDNTLGLAFGMIEDHEMPIGTIVCHPRVYRIMENEITNFTPWNWEQNKPIRGLYKDIPIVTSSMCFQDMVFVVGEPQYVGALMYFDDYEEKHISNGLEQGWSITRACGFVVANDYGVVRIQIS